MKFFKPLFIILCFALSIVSCRKDVFITDTSVKINFSKDTLTFDTVFTSIGSATRFFKVFNPYSKKIKISSIKLAGGDQSHFRINVDGISTIEANDVEIAAHDSLYIYAAVTVDPNNDANPFVIEDSILFETNGNNQKVILNAWGQNAHFYYDSVIVADQHWVNDLPYVIINSMIIDSNVTVTIDPGCRIYNHPHSLIGVKGKLIVNGTAADTVFFRGDRLENYFQDLPGQWGGIIILPGSTGSLMEYTTLQDGDIGVWADDSVLYAQPHVALKQVVIKNMTYAGIRGISAWVEGENTLVYNCGQNNCLQVLIGGKYRFTNCTFVDYSNIAINHQDPAVYLSNYFTADQVNYFFGGCDAKFENCIIWGGLDEELALDFLGTAAGDAIFDSCCIKTDSTLSASSTWFKQDPKFISTTYENYRLQFGSPCVGSGKTNLLTVDLDGLARPLGHIDIGCYER